MTIAEAFDRAENLAQQNSPSTIFLQVQLHLTLNFSHDFNTGLSPYAALIGGSLAFQGTTGNQSSFVNSTFSIGNVLGGDGDPKPSDSLFRFIYPFSTTTVSLTRSVAVFSGATPFTLVVKGQFFDRANNLTHPVSRTFFLNGDDTRTCKLAGFVRNTSIGKLSRPHFVEDDSVPFAEKSFLFFNILSVDVVPPPK